MVYFKTELSIGGIELYRIIMPMNAELLLATREEVHGPWCIETAMWKTDYGYDELYLNSNSIYL
jgi:hypothetical protein